MATNLKLWHALYGMLGVCCPFPIFAKNTTLAIRALLCLLSPGHSKALS